MTLEEASIRREAIQKIAEQLAITSGDDKHYYGDWWDKAELLYQNLISQKNELILDLSKDNEVLEANAETNKTDTESVNTDGGNDDSNADEDSTDWSVFMAHLNESEWDEVEEEVKKLNAPYIIAYESNPYDHFHFLVKITPKQYHTFCKRVFIDKYKLRGQVGRKGTKDEGKIKQYGKMRKEIKSLAKIMKYTIKDQTFRTNMSKEKIERIIEEKIEDVKNTKSDEKLFKDKCLAFVEDRYKPEKHHHKYIYDEIPDELAWTTFIEPAHCIKSIIIQFMLSEKIAVRKTTIESYYYHIIAYSKDKNIKKNSTQIYKQLYHREINT